MNYIPNPAEELLLLYHDDIRRFLLAFAVPRVEQYFKDACAFPRALPIELKGIAV